MIDKIYLKNLKLIRWLHFITIITLSSSLIFCGLSITFHFEYIFTQNGYDLYNYWFLYLMIINIIICIVILIYCNLSAKYNNYNIYNNLKIFDTLKIILSATMILSLVFFLFVIFESTTVYRYPVANDYMYVFKKIGFMISPIIVSLVGLLLEIFIEKLTKNIIVHISLASITYLLIVVTFTCSIMNSFAGILGGLFESETSDIKNYKKFDSYVEMDQGIKKLLPEEVPQSAEDISYYYRYANCIDPDYDIYAEWTLPEDEYLKEKERVMSLFEEQDRKDLDKEDEYTSYVIGADDSNFKSHYYYLIFEYSDETNSVRYICSYCMDNAVDMTPYFMKIN